MYPIEIPDSEILERKSRKAALKLALERSSNSQKAVAIDLGMTEGHLSKALSPDYDVNLKEDQIIPFMVSCGNSIYLRWQYLRLQELLPDLDRQTRPADIQIVNEEIEELKLLLRETISEIKAARPAPACSCGASFALAPGKGFIPKWLLETALWIDWEMERR